MPQLNKQKILNGRKAVDAYRQAHAELHSKPWHRGIPKEHTPLLEQMLKELREAGFNSLDEFYSANEELCYQEIERCYRYRGTCDECKGRQRGCFDECHLPELAEDTKKGRPFYPRRVAFYDWQHFDQHKPPGCSLTLVKMRDPTFDVYWGMSGGVRPEAHERLKRIEGKGINLGSGND